MRDVDLVIFDMYSTLVVPGIQGWVLRKGVSQALDAIDRKVISSDASEEQILADIWEHRKKFEGIYGRDHMVKEQGRRYKNLGMICEEHGVDPARALMIGDNSGETDRLSAERYAIRFRQIPKNPTYSMMQLLNRLERKDNFFHSR